MTTRLIAFAAFLLFVAVFMLCRLRRPARGGMWKVYGSMDCGWTRRQLDHMKAGGINHTFVDCSSEKCPDVDAFPTMIHSQSGETIVGYKEI